MDLAVEGQRSGSKDHGDAQKLVPKIPMRDDGHYGAKEYIYWNNFDGIRLASDKLVKIGTYPMSISLVRLREVFLR